MANVLKVDVPGFVGDAYAEKALTLPGAFYAEYRWAVTQATLTNMSSGGGDQNSAAGLNFTGNAGDGLSGVDFGSTGVWKVLGWFDPAWGAGAAAGSLTGDAWHTVKLYYDGTDITWTFDGVPLFTYALASSDLDSPIQFGATFEQHIAGVETYYLADLKIGTTLGGTDIFAPDISVDLSDFDSTTNPTKLSLVADPFPAPTVGRVLVAFDDTPLAPNPVWTRIDDTDNLVAGIDIETGKQTELDRTDTGTVTLYLNDTTGDYDPINTGSPYFGKLVGKQILVQLYNPVTAMWEPQAQGKIRDYGYKIHEAYGADLKPIVANIQVDCVDIFDYLGGYGIQPYPINGDAPPAGAGGIIFYEDTLGTVDDRIIQALTEAGVDSTRYVVFTGNVKVQETSYDPGDAILTVLRDAADAEFPGIANIYVDRFGRFVFHGRYARFDPEAVIAAGPISTTTWDFHRWKVGDGPAITGDSDYAQIRVLAYSYGESDIVNSAIAWPKHAASEDSRIATQVFEDATSITNHGKHSLPPMGDLIISEGSTTGNDKWVECQKFAEFFVHYLKDPQTRITELMVKAIGPDDPRAASTWDVLCRADISDIMRTTVGYPGAGVGIDIDNYIEGYTKRIRPLNPTHDYVEAEYRLTPTAWAMDPDGVFA